MDYTPIATVAISAITSISAVSIFLKKYLPMAIKYVRIAKDTIVLLDTVITALEDDDVTPKEIETFKGQLAQLKIDIKS